MENTYLVHHGIKGQKWGVRRYQNPDGSLTAEGRKRAEKFAVGKRTAADAVAGGIIGASYGFMGGAMSLNPAVMAGATAVGAMIGAGGLGGYTYYEARKTINAHRSELDASKHLVKAAYQRKLDQVFMEDAGNTVAVKKASY